MKTSSWVKCWALRAVNKKTLKGLSQDVKVPSSMMMPSAQSQPLNSRSKFREEQWIQAQKGNTGNMPLQVSLSDLVWSIP